MDNKAIAGILYETADLLEIDGQDPTGQQLLPVRHRVLVDADEGWKFGLQLGGDGLAVEALLQRVEVLHAAFAFDEEFAVEDGVELEVLDEIGEGF